MTFLAGIAATLIEWLLSYLASAAAKAIKDHSETVAQSEAEDKSNAAALAQLQNAKTKAEKIDAARNILNGL